MKKVIYVWAKKLGALEEKVNIYYEDGYYPHLPMQVFGERLIQPMIRETFTRVKNATATEVPIFYEETEQASEALSDSESRFA